MADLAYIELIERYAGELFDYGCDFNGYLSSDDAVVYSVTVVALDSHGNDVSSTVIWDVQNSGTQVTVRINTLSVEESYTISISVNDSNNNDATQVLVVNVSVPGDY